MNEEFWKQFPPIPDFDCVAMKHSAQLRISKETRGMNVDEIIEYFGARAQARADKVKPPSSAAMLNESPEDYGHE